MGSPATAQLAKVWFQDSIPNDVVLIIADDFGIDKVGCYGKGANLSLTPNIDRIYNGFAGRGGVRFDAAWAMPVCSPTRASILFGRLPDRTGMGTAIGAPEGLGGYAAACAQWEPAPTEVSIAHKLKPLGYNCGQFGKWHLHHPCPDVTGYDFVRDIAGFDHAEGWPYNFAPRANGTGGTETASSYLHNAAIKDSSGVTVEAGIPWIRNGVINTLGDPVPGSLTNVPLATDYTGAYDTGEIASRAIAWMNTAGTPIFAWIAFHGIHVPIQWPPYAQHTQTQNYPNPYAPDPAVAGLPIQEGEFFQTIVDAGYSPAVKPWTYAMIQSLDYQVGRILDYLEVSRPNATVIFIGDNGSYATHGSDGWDVEPPFNPDQAKATMYEGGIQVPLIVNGPWIHDSVRAFKHPVSCADLFSTIVECGGGVGLPTGIDSRSLMPALLDSSIRRTRCGVLSQFFRPVADPALYASTTFTRRWYAARCGPMKLIMRIVDDPGEEMYDLNADPYEATDLLAGGVAGLSGPHMAEYSKLRAYILNWISSVGGL